jgi:hypothetical protein
MLVLEHLLDDESAHRTLVVGIASAIRPGLGHVVLLIRCGW